VHPMPRYACVAHCRSRHLPCGELPAASSPMRIVTPGRCRDCSSAPLQSGNVATMHY
jgi:hypothetical protein